MVRIIENKTNKKELEFRQALLRLTCSDFLGIAYILGVPIENKEDSSQRIRNDFSQLEEEIVDKYSELNRKNRNYILRKIRQIGKSNKIHKE